jgi:flotillin
MITPVIAQTTVLGINLGILLIPFAILAVVIAFLLLAKALASRYVKVGPNQIGVFFGRKYRYTQADGSAGYRGFYILQAGGKVVFPIVESVRIVDVSAFQVEVNEQNIPSLKNVGVNIKGIATCRLSLAEEDLANAVSNFIDKAEPVRMQFIQEILKGHIRSIIGKLEVDDLLRERQKFNEQVIKEASEEFKRIGIQIINLVIQDVRDEHGYIEALGKQAIATTKRDAEIAVAEAEKETAIKTSNAKREAEEARTQNEAKIAEAHRNLSLKQAENKRQIDGENAKAAAAAGLAKADQDKQLAVLEAERDKAKAEAQIAVQEMEKERKKKELEATVLTEAEAKRQAEIIQAEASQQVAQITAKKVEIEAEGRRAALVKTGEGEAQKIRITANAEAEATRAKMSADAEGNQKVALAKAEGERAGFLAKAEGEKAALLARADGERAALLATAEGREKLLLAEALGKQKSLLAEAEGTMKLAEALRQLSEQGRLILILDRLPNLIEKTGDAGAKVAKEVFTAIGTPLGNIKSINITDFGGGTATKNGLRSIGNIVPEIVTDLIVQLKARGVDVSQLAKTLKIDPEGLVQLITGSQTADSSQTVVGGVPPTVTAAATQTAATGDGSTTVETVA